MNRQKKIVLKNLSKTFGNKIVLCNVNLEIFNNESLVIMGGSGTGKSVLLKCIIGLLMPDKGSAIMINDKDYSNIPITKRFDENLEIGVLFQGNALFDSMNICKNITFGLEQRKKIDKAEARKIASEKLAMVELSDNILDLYPVEISGGMQKRVALARVIALNPKLIFFDEPTSGLDPVTSDKISTLIRNVSQKIKATTVTITHDVRCMKKIADYIAVIANQTIIWHSNVADLYKTENPYIRDFINDI